MSSFYQSVAIDTVCVPDDARPIAGGRRPAVAPAGRCPPAMVLRLPGRLGGSMNIRKRPPIPPTAVCGKISWQQMGGWRSAAGCPQHSPGGSLRSTPATPNAELPGNLATHPTTRRRRKKPRGNDSQRRVGLPQGNLTAVDLEVVSAEGPEASRTPSLIAILRFLSIAVWSRGNIREAIMPDCDRVPGAACPPLRLGVRVQGRTSRPWHPSDHEQRSGQ